MTVPADTAPQDAEETYFTSQLVSNRAYWSRFGRRPDFDGKLVLDFGCGHGALSFDMAADGATVLGIDLNEDLVRFARAVGFRQPHPRGHTRFETVDVSELRTSFDLIVSKDTFEHVEDMPTVMESLHRLLKPGGELWVGFSPLYFSPWGDHRRTGLKLPWLHAILPRRLVFRLASRVAGRKITQLADLGLNGLTPDQFRRYVLDAGFEFDRIEYNRGAKPLMRALAAARRLPMLEKWATVSIYAVLRRSHK